MSDCAEPLVCLNGKCLPECREDRDCSAGEVCEESRCRIRGPEIRLCTDDESCAVGETCAEGLCRPATYDAGASRDLGPSSDALPFDLGDSPADFGVDSGADAGGAQEAGPAGDAGAGRFYGSICTEGSQCRSGMCLGPSTGLVGRCTQPCSSDLDCFYPDGCVDVSGAGLLCGPRAEGNPPGAQCPNGPNECSSGLCLSPAGGQPICTQQCSPLPSCPSGLVCEPVFTGSLSIPVCVPGAGRGFGDACLRGTDCASQLCVGAGTAGICTARCASMPCPLGYTCQQVNDPQGGLEQVCASTGSSNGGPGASCTGASSCSSGLCLHNALTGQAFCTLECLSSADCAPIPGTLCFTLLDGSRVCAAI